MLGLPRLQFDSTPCRGYRGTRRIDGKRTAGSGTIHSD